MCLCIIKNAFFWIFCVWIWQYWQLAVCLEIQSHWIPTNIEIQSLNLTDSQMSHSALTLKYKVIKVADRAQKVLVLLLLPPTTIKQFDSFFFFFFFYLPHPQTHMSQHQLTPSFSNYSNFLLVLKLKTVSWQLLFLVLKLESTLFFFFLHGMDCGLCVSILCWFKSPTLIFFMAGTETYNLPYLRAISLDIICAETTDK